MVIDRTNEDLARSLPREAPELEGRGICVRKKIGGGSFADVYSGHGTNNKHIKVAIKSKFHYKNSSDAAEFRGTGDNKLPDRDLEKIEVPGNPGLRPPIFL